MPLLTVFTPAYNRAYTLPRTYESLRRQKCKDFIWMIIDDGSVDNTRELVKGWQEQETEFEIIYIYKENGGMHTAHNTAYEHITTELNVCIDSDDAMAEDAVQKIIDKWEAVKDRGYAGIVGLDADFDGNVIGKGFPAGLKETTLCGYYRNGGKGDKKLVYRTDVINQYPPYPVFEGEKFVALGYKYNLIDGDYKLAVLDEILCNVEYLADGSSRNMFSQYKNNPRGFAFIRKLALQHPSTRARMVINCIHYVSSCKIAGEKHIVKNSPKPFLTLLAYPFGLLLRRFIVYKVTRG